MANPISFEKDSLVYHPGLFNIQTGDAVYDFPTLALASLTEKTENGYAFVSVYKSNGMKDAYVQNDSRVAYFLEKPVVQTRSTVPTWSSMRSNAPTWNSMSSTQTVPTWNSEVQLPTRTARAPATAPTRTPQRTVMSRSPSTRASVQTEPSRTSNITAPTWGTAPSTRGQVTVVPYTPDPPQFQTAQFQTVPFVNQPIQFQPCPPCHDKVREPPKPSEYIACSSKYYAEYLVNNIDDLAPLCCYAVDVNELRNFFKDLEFDTSIFNMKIMKLDQEDSLIRRYMPTIEWSRASA